MNVFINNKYANDAAAPILKDIYEILNALELCDILMPSTSSVDKNNIEKSQRELFYEMANNTLMFVDFKLGLFELDLKELKKCLTKDDLLGFYNISDMIIISICKILGFELGRLFYFVNNFDKSRVNEVQNSFFKIKEFINRLNNLEKTKTSEIEIKKIKKQISKLSKSINNTSFLKRLIELFR